MTPRYAFLLALSLAFAAPIDLPAADADGASWPGWMGPNRDGWVDYVSPPRTWPKELRKVWQVDVGEGYGSPLVDGDRVFQHARQGDDEVVWCVDLKTGDIRWRQSYAVPFKMGGGGERHGKGPKSSPVTSDGRVFTMSITGILTAWRADDGQKIWQRDYASEFETSHPFWGTSTSPLVDQNRVVVHFGNDDKGVLIAHDVESGEQVWSLGNAGASYSSPLLTEIDGVRQIIEWNHESIVGVDSRSGQLLWEYPLPHVGSNQNMPTPTVHEGCVIVGGENRGIRSVEPVRNDGSWTVTEKWHQESVALDMSSAVINEDKLYGFSHYDSGRLFCLDPKSGDVLWTGPPRTGGNVMFLAVPKHIVALIDDGELRILAADGQQHRVVASYRVSDDETWAPPVLLQDGVIIKDKTTLARWTGGDH